MLKSSKALAFRCVISAAIIIITLPLIYYFCLKMTGGLYYLKALNNYRDGYYGISLQNLNKALKYLGAEPYIYKELGEVYHKLSNLKNTAQEALALALKSRDSFITAGKLNPIDVEAAYGTARSEFRIEMIEKIINTGTNDSGVAAKKWFQKAISLRPNSVTYRYGMLNYLAFIGETGAIIEQCKELARIYPQSYYNLRKEPFWSEDVKNTVEQGLQKAVEEGYSVETALDALSALYAEDTRWPDAISALKESMTYRTFEDKSDDLLKLGYYHLKNNNPEKAIDYFIRGLKESRNRDGHFNTVYNYYKKADMLTGFTDLYDKCAESFMVTVDMRMTYARAMMDLEKYDKARELLIKANREESNDEAFYLLARIAEKEKDWDSMELLIQRATVLDPDNEQYHRIFLNILVRMKKWKSAEKEAGLVIQYNRNPSPHDFHRRASIRWNQKNYKGAASDWRNAISLKPNQASFYAQAAEAYAKQDYYPIAAEYYKKALALDPNNEKYRKRYDELGLRGKD